MKRENGAGSITPVGNGRFWVRISHPPSAEHPKGRRESLGTYADLEEAESVRRGALALLAAGLVTPAGRMSLVTFEHRYFELRGLRCRDKQAKREKDRYKKHLRAAPFATTPMGLVTTLEIQRWIDGLATTPAADNREARTLSQETIKKIVRLLRSVFRYAVKDGILEKSPVSRDLELPAPDEQLDDGWDYLRPDEQRALVTCAEIAEPVRLWLAFAMGTGMRPSELFRLLLVDVQADGEAPHVRVRKTKINRPRTIPLFGIALSAWRRWLELLPSYCPKNARGLAWPRPRGGARTGLSLPRTGPKGRQLPEHAVWRSYLRAAGLDRDLRWYDATRHTCATSLLCGWWGPRWTLADVAKVLGHKNTATTQRYAHVADEVLRDAGASTTAPELAALVGPVGHRLVTPAAEISTPDRIRTCDQRLRRPTEYVLIQGVGGEDDQRVDPVDVLRAISRGDAAAAEQGALALADQVLRSRPVQLAQAVIEGGPFMFTRAVELAEMLLDEAAAAVRKVG